MEFIFNFFYIMLFIAGILSICLIVTMYFSAARSHLIDGLRIIVGQPPLHVLVSNEQYQKLSSGERASSPAAAARPNDRQWQHTVEAWKKKIGKLETQVDALQDENNKLRAALADAKREKEVMQEFIIPTPEPEEEAPSSAPDVIVVPTPQAEYYAYSASSVTPYGFLPADLMTDRDLQPFVIKQLSEDTAELNLQSGNPDVRRQLLGTLTYYNRLIDYVNEANGPVSTMNVTQPGRLRLENDVWTVEERVKIVLL